MCVVGFHEWWNAAPLRQNLVNCSGCAEISSVLEVPESLRGTVALRRGPQLVLLKVRGQHGVDSATGPPSWSLGACDERVLCIQTVPCPSPCLQGGESLSVQRQQLEELYLAHSGSMSILLEEEEDGSVHSDNLRLPQGPANFTLLWYTFSFKAFCRGF